MPKNANIALRIDNTNSLGGQADVLAQAHGFVQGTLIVTAAGQVAVEDLSPGALVLTLDNGYRPLLEVHRQSSAAHLVVLQAGALGHDLPAQELRLLPSHRILLRSGLAQSRCEEREVLAVADDLVDEQSIRNIQAQADCFQLCFAQHEVIFANGAPCESLYEGGEPARILLQSDLARELCEAQKHITAAA